MNRKTSTSTSTNPDTDADARDVAAHAPPSEQTHAIDGVDFTFRPLRVKQFFPFLALARPIFAALAKASSPPAPGLPPAPADGQGGEPTPDAVQAPNIQALVADGDAMLALLETEGPAAIRALAVGLEPNQSPESQQAMVDQLEELTMVGLLVAIKHFVVVNAGFFAAQGLRLPQGGLLGAPSLATPTDADRARAGSAAAASRPQPRKR